MTADHPSRIIGIASSAGGLSALTRLLELVEPTIAAPILVVQHLAPSPPSMLAEILDRCTNLQVNEAREGARAVPGAVYVATPGLHLTMSDDCHLSLSAAPAVGFLRPRADLLFESLARTFAERTIAVILSGTGADGAVGARAVHARAGAVIVQDPSSAEFAGMPAAALATGAVDEVLELEEIALRLHALAAGPVEAPE